MSVRPRVYESDTGLTARTSRPGRSPRPRLVAVLSNLMGWLFCLRPIARLRRAPVKSPCGPPSTRLCLARARETADLHGMGASSRSRCCVRLDVRDLHRRGPRRVRRAAPGEPGAGVGGRWKYSRCRGCRSSTPNLRLRAGRPVSCQPSTIRERPGAPPMRRSMLRCAAGYVTRRQSDGPRSRRDSPGRLRSPSSPSSPGYARRVPWLLATQIFSR